MFSGVRSSCKKQAFAGRSQYIWEERFQLISKYTGTVGDLITSTSLVKCPKMNSLDFFEEKESKQVSKIQQIGHASVLRHPFKLLGVFFYTDVFLSSSYLSFPNFDLKKKYMCFSCFFLRRSKMDLVSFLGMVYRLHKVPWVPMKC